MARTGRPRKESSRRNVEKFLLSDRESREIREFAALNHMSKSEFIRQSIAKSIEDTRNRLGLSAPEDEYFDEYYDDFNEFDEDNEDDDQELAWP